MHAGAARCRAARRRRRRARRPDSARWRRSGSGRARAAAPTRRRAATARPPRPRCRRSRPRRSASLRRTVAPAITFAAAVASTPSDAADHRRRATPAARLLAEERLARRHAQQVRAELVELRQQVGARGLGDPQHGDHRGDADRDAERRQGGARPAACAGRSSRCAGRRRPVDWRRATTRGRRAISTRRGIAAAISRSCVITRIVAPSACSSRRSATISAPGAAVEVAGRLVGEHDRGPRDERAGDRDALALAAGELRRVVAEPVAEADPLEHLAGPARAARRPPRRV